MIRFPLAAMLAVLAFGCLGCIAQIHYVVPPVESKAAKALADSPQCHVGPALNDVIGIGVSGGGSRAAVYGAAGLEALWEHGMIEHVTHLSSVSGGSIAASYFATNRPSCEEASSEAEHDARQMCKLDEILPHKHGTNAARRGLDSEHDA